MVVMIKRKLVSRGPFLLLVTGLFLCFGVSPLCSKIPFSFDNIIQDEFDYRNGFPLDYVSCISQSGDGYLWLAGKSSILRYDGTHFESVDKGYAAIFVDRTGALWFSKVKELISIFHGVKSRYTYPEELYMQTGIKALADDREGNIWIAVNRGPLVQFDRKHFVVHENIRSVTAMAEGGNGDFWIASYQEGLYLSQKSRIVAASELGLNISFKNITSLFVDSDDVLWVGTNGYGLYSVFKRTGTKQWTIRQINGSDGKEVSVVTLLRRGNHGELFVATSNGICILQRNTDGSLGLTKPYMAGSSVQEIFMDHEGSLWLSSLARGLIRLRQGCFQYKRDIPSFSPTLFCAGENDIWIGMYMGGLVHFVDQKNVFYERDVKSEGISVISIAADGDGLLLGTGREGLFEFVNGQFRRLDGFPREQKDLGVMSILRDYRGRLLAGTTAGLMVQGSSGQLRRYGSNDLLPSDFLYQLLEDGRQDLWICSSKGVARFEQGNLQRDSRSLMLPDTNVLFMLEDQHEKGRYWFCTLGTGLKTVRDGIWTTFNIENGLGSNDLYQMIEDDRQQFWITSQDGIIMVLERKELLDFAAGKSTQYSCLNLGRADGLAPISYHTFRPQYSIIKTAGGTLWFTTSNGIAIIDPDNISINRRSPRIALKELHVDGERILGERHQFRGRRNITFHMALLTFVDQERAQLEYRLEGLQEDWHTLEPRERSLTFTDLPRGIYNLKVKVKNREGFVSPEAFQFDFQFSPYFWETPVFLLFLFLVMALGIFFGLWTRRRLKLLKKLEALQRGPDTWSEQTRRIHHQVMIEIESEKVYRDEAITLEKLARKVGTQPWELSKVINESMKQNFWTLINGYRVREAQELLTRMKQSGQSILDICYEVGFSSKSSFYRSFKKISGMSPNEYVRSLDDQSLT